MNTLRQALLYIGLVVVSIMSIRSVYGVVMPHVRSNFKKSNIVQHEVAVVHTYPSNFNYGYLCEDCWRNDCDWRYPYWRRYGYGRCPYGVLSTDVCSSCNVGFCLDGRSFRPGFGW